MYQNTRDYIREFSNFDTCLCSTL